MNFRDRLNRMLCGFRGHPASPVYCDPDCCGLARTLFWICDCGDRIIEVAR